MTQPLEPGAGTPPRFDPATGQAPTERVDPTVTPVATPPPEWRATAAPLADVIAKPKPSTGRGTSLLLALAAAIAVGGIAFAAGRLTAPAATATAGRTGPGQLPGGGQGFPGGGQGFPGGGQGFPGGDGGFRGINVSGEVTAISADSITLKLASGSTLTLPLDGDTAYHRATSASAGDVTVGSQVSVTPGGRAGNPNATLDPNASPGPGAGISFGPATDVTLTEP